jgi:hypothetical protein
VSYARRRHAGAWYQFLRRCREVIAYLPQQFSEEEKAEANHVLPVYVFSERASGAPRHAQILGLFWSTEHQPITGSDVIFRISEILQMMKRWRSLIEEGFIPADTVPWRDSLDTHTMPRDQKILGLAALLLVRFEQTKTWQFCWYVLVGEKTSSYQFFILFSEE